VNRVLLITAAAIFGVNLFGGAEQYAHETIHSNKEISLNDHFAKLRNFGTTPLYSVS